VIRFFGQTFAKQPTRALRAQQHQSCTCRPQVEILEGRQLLSGTTSHLLQGYAQIPLSFEPNQGQTAAPVQFLSRGPGYTLFLTPAAAVLRLQKTAPPTPGQLPSAARTADVVLMQLIGGNVAPRVVGLDWLPGVSNYLLGNDPSQWHTNVPFFGGVEYDNAYRGIGLVYYGHQGQLEYDFVLAPGSDPAVIQLAFQGEQRGMSLDAQGNLVLHTADGDLIEHAPDLYQEWGGVRRAVAGQFMLEGGGRLGFAVGAYDPTQPLTIDPKLLWSTYLGGSGQDYGQSIAVNQYGQAYVTGYTASPDFPTLNALQKTKDGNSDAFVAKFSAGGSLLWSTYFGGSDFDYGFGIAVNQYGDAYVAGQTYSVDFPTLNAFQAANGGSSDAFVAKFSTGGALLWSTYLGGTGFDYATGIAVDPSGHAYVTGYTGSTDFPTRKAFQRTSPGNGDAFVARLSTGGALLYSTYLGGSTGLDYGTAIAADQNGNAYVTGSTDSSDFPIRNAFQAAYGYSGHAFVAKFSVGGSLLWSTYLGGSGFDSGQGIAVDQYGNAYVTGTTNSSNFPSLNPFQAADGGGYDAFVAKFSTGGALLWSTYLGGNNDETGYGIALDQYGDAYVTGSTSSTDFPTLHAFRATYGGTTDTFVAKFSTGGSLLYSSYLGGSSSDAGYGIAVDQYGHAYVTGLTYSTDFPTVHAYQAQSGFPDDAFVAKIS
jgi:hypothetical protein